jgi:hypothetical protein
MGVFNLLGGNKCGILAGEIEFGLRFNSLGISLLLGEELPAQVFCGKQPVWV